MNLLVIQDARIKKLTLKQIGDLELTLEIKREDNLHEQELRGMWNDKTLLNVFLQNAEEQTIDSADIPIIEPKRDDKKYTEAQLDRIELIRIWEQAYKEDYKFEDFYVMAKQKIRKQFKSIL